MAAAYQSLPQSRGKPFFFELNTDNAVYEGYHPDPPRGLSRCCCCCCSPTTRTSTSAQDSSPTCSSCLLSRCDALSFKDWETETLYQQFAYAFRRSLLCRLLLLHSLALVCMCGVDLALTPNRLGFKTLVLTGLLTVHLLLFVHLNCRLMRKQHFPVLTALSLLILLLAVGISLPVEWTFIPTAQLHATGMRIEPDKHYAMPDGLWTVAFITLCIYAFAPIGMFVTLPFCGALSALHLTVAALMAVPKEMNSYYWRMLGSNCLVLFAVNLVGLIIHRGQERQLRQIFTDTRDCITNRIANQEESDKLGLLCAVVAPEPLISDLRRDFLSMTESSTGARSTNTSTGANPSGRFPLVINHLRNISFMSCDMLPITNFPSDFAASEAIRLLNEVYGRFDQLAQEYSCFRVYLHSEQYLCICGYPDTKMDHAKSCVELAFAILEQINNLSDSTELGIDIRLAVHTGDAYANILGKTRLAFDLTGEDASIAKQLHSSCSPGRVLVSKATFDQLPDGYRAESGPLLDLSPTPDGRCTRVETYYIKPRHYRSSSNLRGASGGGGGGGPRRARYTRLQALEPSQKRSGLVRITQCAKFNASSPYMFLAEDLQKQCVKLRDSEEFVRKPFKRKSVTTWTVSLQRYMALTVNGSGGDGCVEESPVCSVRSLSMNPITLRFHDPVEERGYHANEDWTFGRCMVTALCLLLASAALQAVILPRTVLLLLLFMIAFTWIGMMLLVVLVTKLRCLEFNVQSSAAIRLVVIVTSVLFIYAVSQVNVFCCQRVTNTTVAGVLPTPSTSRLNVGRVRELSAQVTQSTGLLAPSSALLPSHLSCDLPQYLPLSCVLNLLVLTAFMSLPAIGKLPLSILIFTSYTVVIEVTHKSLFDHYDAVVKWTGLPGHVQAILCMTLFVVFVYVQGRFMEYTMRLGHLWRSQARDNLEEAERFRECSELVLKNVLPEHVALYFLDNTYRNPVGLYSQDYNCLGVLCASVPTWQMGGDTTIHDDIRRLNDLIVQFDNLLLQEKFAPLDKVRALFNGYVTAVGVNPIYLLEDNTSKMQYLTLLVQFAMSMKRVADEANAAMGVNRMKMRIGIHAGSGFSGVVGAQRPSFDIWGEAFQLAAILERAAVLQQIHVSATVVTYTQAQFDFVEHAQLPLPSPTSAGSNLTSFVLCESQHHHAARLHNKRYSVPCNSQPVPPAALPSHTSHSVSRSAMRAVRQNSLSVAAPLPVVSSVPSPPQSHQQPHQQPHQPLPSHPEQDQHLIHHQQRHQQLQNHQKIQPSQHQQLPNNSPHYNQQSNQHFEQFQHQNNLQHPQPIPSQQHQEVGNHPQFQNQLQQNPQLRQQFHQQQMPHHQNNSQHQQQMQNHHQYQNQPFPQPQQQQFVHQQQQTVQQAPQQFQHIQQAVHRQPSAPHTPASEVAPSLPPRPSNPVGSEMAAETRLPTASQSSLNSFLQMEDACSSVPRPGLMVGDHYNPLYTDNEYDTDMDAAFATRSGPGPRLSPNPRPGSDSSAGLHGRGSGDCNSPGLPNLAHQLDFPDYQRPASPGGPPSLSGLPNMAPPSPPGHDVDEASLPLGTETLDSVMTQDDGPGLVFTLSGSGRGVRLKPTGRGGGRARRRGVDTEDEVEEVEDSDLDSNAGPERRIEADSELEAVRLQSDLASELSEQLFVSDIEDAVGERLYRFPAGNRLAQRPTTLPDVAPVGLPDFSLLGGPMRREGEEDDDEEERRRLREAAALERRRERFRGGIHRRAAAGSPSVRSEYDNMCSESDAGYTGDVASSAYEEDSCDDDEDSDLDFSGHFRAALRGSDYDNMAAAVTGMMDVNNVFNEQIAEEARRISHVFQQQQWNGAMDTATSQGEEDEEDDPERDDHVDEVTEVANAAPHEDGGESPMSLPPELSKSETLVALLGGDPHQMHDEEAPLSMTSSFSEVATTSEVGESEYDNYDSDAANGELSSSSWFTGFPLHQFEPNPPSSGGTGGAGSNSRTTVV